VFVGDVDVIYQCIGWGVLWLVKHQKIDQKDRIGQGKMHWLVVTGVMGVFLGMIMQCGVWAVVLQFVEARLDGDLHCLNLLLEFVEASKDWQVLMQCQRCG